MQPALSDAPVTGNRFRRARPLLGTFVEIEVWGESDAVKQTASDAAFDAIALVEKRMSRFDPDSDVSRLNRGQSPQLHPWTLQVLDFCDHMTNATDDRFAPWANGLLDLGGVAKGFAVDCAVETLKKHGLLSGVVNAGGDLAVFGPHAHTIHRRNPRQPAHLLAPIALQNEALASSAPAFDPILGVQMRASAITDPQSQSPATGALGVSVRAPTAMAADALTKVVMIMGVQAFGLLAQWQAEAWLIQADNTQYQTDGWT